MANRQIFQLTPRVLSATDVFLSQDPEGIVEAGNATFTDLKLLMQGGARKFVLRLSKSPSFSYTTIEDDYNGLTILAVSNPLNGVINIQVDSSIFSTTKSVFLVNSIDAGGVPYFVCPKVTAGDTITLNIFLYNGTQTGTPNFDNYMITIITYP